MLRIAEYSTGIARNFARPMQLLRGRWLLPISLPSATVLRTVLRPYLALLLLLCLVRTLLPEAWVLALHDHEHTTEEPAQVSAFQHKGKALVSKAHKHCQVEDFYNVAFAPSAPVVVPVPVTRPCFATAPVPTVATAPWIARQPAQLRGPPVA